MLIQTILSQITENIRKIMRNHKKQQHSRKLLQWAAQASQPCSSIQWRSPVNQPNSSLTLQHNHLSLNTNPNPNVGQIPLHSRQYPNIPASPSSVSITSQKYSSNTAKQVISNLLLQNSQLRTLIYTLQHESALLKLQFQNKQLQYRNIIAEYRVILDDMFVNNSNSNSNSQRNCNSINSSIQQNHQNNQYNDNQERNDDSCSELSRDNFQTNNYNQINFVINEGNWEQRRKWLYDRIQEKYQAYQQYQNQICKNVNRMNRSGHSRSRRSQSLNKTNSICLNDESFSKQYSYQNRQNEQNNPQNTNNKIPFMLNPCDYLCFDTSKILQPYTYNNNTNTNNNQIYRNEPVSNQYNPRQHLPTVTSATDPMPPAYHNSPYLLQYQNNPTVNLLVFADDNNVNMGKLFQNRNMLSKEGKDTAGSSKAQTQRLHKQAEKQREKIKQKEKAKDRINSEVGINWKSQYQQSAPKVIHRKQPSGDKSFESVRKRKIAQPVQQYSSEEFKSIVEKGRKNRQRIQQLLKNCVKIGEAWK